MSAAGLVACVLWRTLRHQTITLRGRVALVTGGSRGLGLLLGRELADQGCRIVICARDEQELERARMELSGRGADVLAVPCDVADPQQIQHLVEAATAAFGSVDLVFNNAGIIQVGPLESTARDDFAHALAVNFWGTLNVILAVLPQMRARRSGRIVNITSIGGKVAVPHLLPYDCAKFAAVGLSEGLRSELARDGIEVTTIVPGLMRTGSPVNALFKGQAAREYTWFSIGDALPLISVSARRAARRIVRAARRGEAEVTISSAARVLRVSQGLFPGLVADALALGNRALPSADAAVAQEQVRGMQLATALSPSPITVLMNRAARTNNQLGGSATPAPEHARKLGIAPD